MTALWEAETIFCLISRSHRVDAQQSRNSILSEWIGMGRSGPQITAKRQLWDCVTLTMVLLSLLFRAGKFVFFVSPPPSLSSLFNPSSSTLLLHVRKPSPPLLLLLLLEMETFFLLLLLFVFFQPLALCVPVL